MNRSYALLAGTATLLTGLAVGMSALPAPLSRQTPQEKPAFTAEQVKFFENEVKPILKANCFACHSGGNASGGFQFASRESVLKGGASGTAVNLKKPEESLLLKVVHYTDAVKMPPQGKLPQAKIDTLTRWVALGLPWTPGEAVPAAPVKHGPPAVNAETMKFWSFQPVKTTAVPHVQRTAWVRNPIDAFVLSKLEANHFTPAPFVGRVGLLRRAYYDLIGLPPSPDEVKAFLSDTSPDAYEKVIDRLLASPQYGERWGRHWLDLVRYAETNSFERDDPKPFVWRYRDYVIQSLNADKPYDQFVREQLAGDELDKVTPETLIATGYYRLGLWDDEPADPIQARYDELDDVVGTTGQVFLGLTVNCARCHDHKLDPIPQKDYYRMLAFFQGINRYGDRSYESVQAKSLRPISPEAEQKRFAVENAAYQKQLAAVNDKIVEVERIVRKDLSPVEKEEFQSRQARLPIVKKRVPALLTEAQLQQYSDALREQARLMRTPPRGLEQALCVTEVGRAAPKTFLLMRGNPHVPGDEVQPGFLSVLNPPAPELHEPAPNVASSGRRLALANWITSPNNPLTARVMVNRVWQHHFGRGIVRTTSNFGMLGTAPTHPELLDWLAGEFMRNGWRLKPLHKMIMLSNAYRMASQGDPKALAKDPENDLLWRFDMRRLDAEEIRDSILAANGSLNLKMYGPSIYPEIPAEVLAGQSRPGAGWGKSSPEEAARRSIYVHSKRSLPLPMLASFDSPDTDATCPIRFATTQPTQALGMMNSAFINREAGVFADFLQKNAGTETTAQVKLGLTRTLQREPSVKEITRGVNYIASLQTKYKMDAKEALRSFCVLVLNLNEFIYLD